MADTDTSNDPEVTPGETDERTDEQLWDELDGNDDDPNPDDLDGDDGDRRAAAGEDEDDAPGDEPAVSEADDDESPSSEEGEAEEDPVLANAPPETRKYIEKLHNDLKAAHGRVRALMKGTAKRGTSADLKKAGEDMQKTREALEQAKTEYPDVVGPVIDRLDSIAEKVDAIDSDSEAQRLALLEAEQNLLLERHPDAFDVIEKNADTFREWVEDQPKRIRDAVAQNVDAIIDADAVSEVVNEFKAFLSGGESAPAEHETRNSRADHKRQRKLAGARTTRTTGQKRTVDPPPESDDPEAQWDYWERFEKRRGRSDAAF